ncbi:hypothetical protein K438DRAFT_1759449 [Mycena galopus ATCC 62051]|nr:hypothetical protein K438DRAFT_1759449 [Mycena galopus ATCC 62051]
MNKKDGLAGSSSTNPWTLSSQGRLFPPGTFSSLGTKHLIIGGPPSSIKQDVPPTTEPYAGSAKTGIQYVHGKCTRRSEPLTASQLYHTSTCPVAEVPTVGHRCVICAGVKSHPILYVRSSLSLFISEFTNNYRSQCGHSYCYVGIHMHLEDEWTCPYPDCNRVMGKGSRGGARPPPPMMHVHAPHIGQIVTMSTNGRRANTSAHPVNMVPSVPVFTAEDINTNAAVESLDFSYDLGDTSLHGELQEPETDGIKLKRKVYENSDYPMRMWAEHQDEYLDEMLRLEGRGYPAIHSWCGDCQHPTSSFRCENGSCHGPSLYCAGAVEWGGHFFQRRSLKSLGLIVHLGHPLGYACPTPVPANKAFVVFDVTSVHNVEQLMRVRWWPVTARDPQTCTMFGVVHLFQLLNCLGKVSAHDFLRSLKLLTNTDSLNPLPDRHHAFHHIVRQYRTTLMMKRAGQGHHPGGINGTAQCELALQCRAFPQPGKNLPERWDKINWDAMPEDLRYKYFLFLAQDCNFRLINRNMGSVGKDPILGDGYVNNARYAEYICLHTADEEISSCSGFQAMFLATKKRVKGLRTTGVGGVTCARHNMWHPNGIGDLQLGERHANVDFILSSSILNLVILYLILFYDTACQYLKNLWTRMATLQQDMCQIFTCLVTGLVVMDLSRSTTCVARGGHMVRREFTNGVAPSTKMMGIGTRHATLEDLSLEDLFGFHNWCPLVTSRRLFPSRMAEDVKEGQAHREAFEAFNDALRVAMVHEWESSQHKVGDDSPFEQKENMMSMRDIQLKLAREETLQSRDDVEVECEDTPSTFVSMGMDIEETQCNLTIDVKSVADPTPTQTTQWALWDTETERDPEAVHLFLPSDLSDKMKCERACAVGLSEVEAELRVGEVQEALHALRHGLRTRTMTNRFRLCHCMGQCLLTRGQGMLCQTNLKFHRAKLRYRYARNGLMHERTWAVGGRVEGP